MKHFFTLLVMWTLFSVPMEGQTARAFEKAGDKAFQNKNYSAALHYYQNAMGIKEKKVSLWYKYAEVARLFHSYEIAESYYKRVSNSAEAKAFPLTFFWLGKVKKSVGDYEKAKEYFTQYLQENDGKTLFGELATSEINDCEWAAELVSNPGDETVEQLSKRVNSAFSEFSPLMRNDTLYFSSFRFDHPKDDFNPPRKISRVLYSIKGRKGRSLPRKFNEKEKLTAHTTFSADGKKVFYTICEYKGEAEIRCDLYLREMGKRKRWGKPVKVPKPINVEGMTTTHPHLVLDSLTGIETLYFVSNRPGGKGQLDIWFCDVPQKGKWKEPTNLSAVNTAGDELTPFYHSVSNTLFFSSDGRQGLGGYDIYKINQIGDAWGEVEHTGYPLNTSYNDVYFTLNADSTEAYLSSNRLGSMYLDKDNKTCCNDIYRVKIKEPKVEEPIVSIPPVDTTTLIVEIPPVEPETVIPPVKIPPPPPTTLEDFLPLALFFDNDEPDKRTRRNTTKKSYEETYFRYYERREQFRETYTSELDGEERIAAEDQLDLFFDEKVKRGYDYLGLFSDILLKRLEAGEKVEIFVKGFTSPRAKSDYNIHLGKRRISSVKNHFKTYRNGIFKTYLQSNQLIITERSFGETTASTAVNDDLNNQRLSVYSPEASQERRVEIVEIKRE